MVLKVQCDACAARYKLDESRIKGKGARITCPKCGHQFVVYKRDLDIPDVEDDDEPATIVATQDALYPPEALSGRSHARPQQLTEERPSPPAGPPPLPRPTSVNALNWREVGLTSFKAKLSFGLVYDFSDVATFKKAIADKKVQITDSLSMDGRSWVPITEIGDLDTWFIDRWVELKKARMAAEEVAAEKVTVEEDSDLEEEDPTDDQLEAVQPGGAGARSQDSMSSGGGLLSIFDGTELPEDEPPPADLSATLAPRPVLRPPPSLIDDRADAAFTPPPPRPAAPPMAGGERAVLALLLVLAAGLGWAWASGAMASGVGDAPDFDAAADSRALKEATASLFPSLEGPAPSQEAPAAVPAVSAPPPLPPPDVQPPAPSQGAAPAPRKGRGQRLGTDIQVHDISAEDQVELGDALMASGDRKGAAAAYEKAAEMKPGEAGYQLKLGQAYLAAGAPKKAERAFKQALKLKPSLVDAQRYLGECYEKMGREQDAAAAYRRYLEGKPGASDRAEIEARLSRLG